MLEIQLKLADSVSPVVRVADKGFRKRWNLCIGIFRLEIDFRVDIFGEQCEDLSLFIFL